MEFVVHSYCLKGARQEPLLPPVTLTPTSLTLTVSELIRLTVAEQIAALSVQHWLEHLSVREVLDRQYLSERQRQASLPFDQPTVVLWLRRRTGLHLVQRRSAMTWRIAARMSHFGRHGPLLQTTHTLPGVLPIVPDDFMSMHETTQTDHG